MAEKTWPGPTEIDCAPDTAETPISAQASLTALPGSTENFHGPTLHIPNFIARIEPAFASTLMALTEPFLMVWCSDSKDSVPALNEEEREAFLQVHVPTSMFPEIMTSSFRNSWGY